MDTIPVGATISNNAFAMLVLTMALEAGLSPEQADERLREIWPSSPTESAQVIPDDPELRRFFFIWRQDQIAATVKLPILKKILLWAVSQPHLVGTSNQRLFGQFLRSFSVAIASGFSIAEAISFAAPDIETLSPHAITTMASISLLDIPEAEFFVIGLNMLSDIGGNICEFAEILSAAPLRY